MRGMQKYESRVQVLADLFGGMPPPREPGPEATLTVDPLLVSHEYRVLAGVDGGRRVHRMQVGDPSFSSQDRDRPTLSRAEFLPITPTAASLGATQQQYSGAQSSEHYGHCPARGESSRPESCSGSLRACCFCT